MIPPAYGLAGVKHATFTGDGDISYWNAYVAVTQMGGQGAFKESKLNIDVKQTGPDLVTPKLAALRDYQHSLARPAAAAGSFDDAAAKRGQALFAGSAKCATCHQGSKFTDDKLHDPAETGMEPTYAARSASKKYRTTPLRGLARHAPYFHDGRAATLPAVVDHYAGVLKLQLTAGAEEGPGGILEDALTGRRAPRGRRRLSGSGADEGQDPREHGADHAVAAVGAEGEGVPRAVARRARAARAAAARGRGAGAS